MRGRPDEPDPWGDLYERYRRPGDPPRRRGERLSPEATGRLYDAALGIVGSIRTFLDVAEEVLEERRARLGEPAPSPWVRGARRGPAPTSDDQGATVRDIPFGDR